MKYVNSKYICSDAKEMDLFFYNPLRDADEKPAIYPPDHTDAIFDVRYQVKLPTIATRSIESLYKRGLNVTGIKSVDDAMPYIWVYPYLTINEMIIIRGNGYDITFVNADDLVAVWKAIDEYLAFWNAYNRQHNIDVHSNVNVPREDLIDLEEFMGNIYPMVQDVVGKEVKRLSSTIIPYNLGVAKSSGVQITDDASLAPSVTLSDDKMEFS